MDIRAIFGMAAASAALLAAQPALAAVDTTWSVSETASDSDGNELTETANGQVLTSDASTMTIALNCTARALPRGAGTGITLCYLEGADGTRYSVADNTGMPGPADTDNGVIVDAPRQPYKVCV